MGDSYRLPGIAGHYRTFKAAEDGLAAKHQGDVRAVLLTMDREMRVYIAGPMTGLPEYNFPAFNAMAEKMREAGWHVENPADHGHVAGAGWADYLRYDIGCLSTCEAIMLLPGWSSSRGARLEVSIAKELGLVFMFSDGAEQPEPVAQYKTYTTQPSESLAGMAGRQLKDESRWIEIRDANALEFPDMAPNDYYPVGTAIRVPCQ